MDEVIAKMEADSGESMESACNDMGEEEWAFTLMMGQAFAAAFESKNPEALVRAMSGEAMPEMSC